MNNRASEVTIRHRYKSNRDGFSKIEVEVVFSFSYMGIRMKDGSPQRRWDSRTYTPTPESLIRVLDYIEKAEKVEQYLSHDSWDFSHEITYERRKVESR